MFKNDISAVVSVALPLVGCLTENVISFLFVHENELSGNVSMDTKCMFLKVIRKLHFHLLKSK